MQTPPQALRSNRRAFLGRSGLGLMSLLSLLNQGLVGGAASASPKWTGVVNPLHHPPRAKRVIFLYMAGGPSHLETFDYKPQLARLHGQPMPESFTKGQQVAQLQNQEWLVCAAVCPSKHGLGPEISVVSHRVLWPTTCASSVRWSPTPSITIQLTRS
jgi:hypothetical protein